MKKEFLHKQVPKSVLSLHFSELVCVKMVIFTKFWVEGEAGDFPPYFRTYLLIFKPKPYLWWVQSIS